ncbi:Ribonuclease/ribotoxin [Sodiomyces alkalinus F11]|uniref:ribonuclease T1 n=1 Tax=Sodiomyces alkalinus (strain CBS 110278 / VKM F-3762 / F11) TaxID=1314773 RepID=A0A3N2Q447_SODAK|nr:Ribonuclease/ribotoxin [Sodiomyces alkalinus F11]ROT41405.1 Ribonuclease/ribotoxin [Sodiomyces alkalinus F11]
MQYFSFAVAALALCAHVVAQDVVCGRNEYSREEIQAAADAACEHFESGTTAGRSTYPHAYRNFEGFEFDGIDGPYQGFPLLSSGRVYTGGELHPGRIGQGQVQEEEEEEERGDEC